MRFTIATVFSATSNGANSLEEIFGPADGDICYVQENNRFYRWVAASTATPAGNLVVKKAQFNVSEAGRWLVEGPPGPGKIPPGFANALQTGLSLQLVQRFQAVTTGGAPTEVVDFAADIPALSGTLWSIADSILIATMESSNPAVMIRGNVPSANGAEALIVDTAAVNIPAGLPVRGWLYRLAS